MLSAELGVVKSTIAKDSPQEFFRVGDVFAEFTDAFFEFVGEARVVFARYSLTPALSQWERESALIPDPSPEGGRESPSPFERGVRGEGASDDLINIRLHSLFLPMHDLPVQALFGGHAFRRIGSG